MAEQKSQKENIKDTILALLGGNMIDVQLDTGTLDASIKFAINKYSTISEHAEEEAYVFYELPAEKNEVYLPPETVNVRQIFRSRYGLGQTQSNLAGSTDPFAIAAVNMYILQSSGTGGLTSYYLYHTYLKTAGNMFGAHIPFIYDRATKKLTFSRNLIVPENVILWVYKEVSDEVLLQDKYRYQWILEYSLAITKRALGNAYEQYTQLAGPQGGITLNGAQLKAEGVAEIEKLELSIKNYGAGETPAWFVIG